MTIQIICNSISVSFSKFQFFLPISKYFFCSNFVCTLFFLVGPTMKLGSDDIYDETPFIFLSLASIMLHPEGAVWW